MRVITAVVLKKASAAVVEGVGLPICSLAQGWYREYKLRLEKGDSLYLYTDGITEARNNRCILRRGRHNKGTGTG